MLTVSLYWPRVDSWFSSAASILVMREAAQEDTTHVFKARWYRGVWKHSAASILADEATIEAVEEDATHMSSLRWDGFWHKSAASILANEAMNEAKE